MQHRPSSCMVSLSLLTHPRAFNRKANKWMTPWIISIINQSIAWEYLNSPMAI